MQRASILCGMVGVLTCNACGARDALFIDGMHGSVAPDAALTDVVQPQDAGIRDAEAPTDVVVADHPMPPGCEGTAPRIWLLSDAGQLYVFDPDALTVAPMAKVDCGTQLNSMAISRANVAYVSAINGSLFTVDLDTGRCDPTPFQQPSFGYGMGFAVDSVGLVETLYVSPKDQFAHVNAYGTIDVFGTFQYREVARFNPPLPSTELQGSGDGSLYGMHIASLYDPALSAELFRLDKTTGTLFDRVTLPEQYPAGAYHFVVWAGTFYFFYAPGFSWPADVIRYTPGEGPPKIVTTIAPAVIGASGTTCAPL